MAGLPPANVDAEDPVMTPPGSASSPSQPPTNDFGTSLAHTTAFLLARDAELASSAHATIPAPGTLATALLALPTALPARGWGTSRTTRFVLEDVAPGLWTGHAGGRNFGFVSGGVGAAAQLADMVVGSCEYRLAVTR